MEITLGEATKLLDNIMVNYSQWHTERSTNKKVHVIGEINVLSGKTDELMKLFANKSVSSDPNDMPLSTCNAPDTPAGGCYSWRDLDWPHRSILVFSAHFVLTRAHPGATSRSVTHPEITPS